MKADTDYKKAVDSIADSVLDFAESHLYKLVKEGNPAATIFFLKTKGKEARVYRTARDRDTREEASLVVR
jgi:serine/threonine-protein kinase RIO1